MIIHTHSLLLSLDFWQHDTQPTTITGLQHLRNQPTNHCHSYLVFLYPFFFFVSQTMFSCRSLEIRKRHIHSQALVGACLPWTFLEFTLRVIQQDHCYLDEGERVMQESSYIVWCSSKHDPSQPCEPWVHEGMRMPKGGKLRARKSRRTRTSESCLPE